MNKCGEEGGLNDEAEGVQEDEKKRVDENNLFEKVHGNEEGFYRENRFDLLGNTEKDSIIDGVEEEHLQKIIFEDTHIQGRHKRNSSFGEDDAMTSRFNRRGAPSSKRQNSTFRKMQIRSSLRSCSNPAPQDDDFNE
ncbi:UNVERIFIED_CONTAM: hypothetical protein Sindi_1859200 [Sesamum indicum]